MKGSVAREGVALARLTNPIFDMVAQGELPVQRAVAIGETLTEAAEQKAAVDLLSRAEKRGKRLTNDEIRELVKFVKQAPRESETVATLFGDEEITRSLAIEKAEISSYVKQRLGKERRLFSAVGSESNAAQLSSAGNVIRASENAKIAEEVSHAQAIYDKLSSYSGPIADALEEGAQGLSKGVAENAVKERTYERIRQIIAEEAVGRTSTGNPEGVQATPERRGSPGTNAVEPHDLFSRRIPPLPRLESTHA